MKTPDINRIRKSIARQQDKSDCGVACLLSVIQYYGGAMGLERLRNISGTDNKGTTLLGLYQAALELGFDAEGCESEIEELVNYELPCVLHVVNEGKLQHYLVYYGVLRKKKETLLVIGDPSKGLVFLTIAALKDSWKSKTLLILTPNSGFQKTAIIGKAKRQWIRDLIITDLPLLLIAAVLGVAIAGLGLVMAIFSQKLVDNILPAKDITRLALAIVLVFALLVIKEGLSAVRQYLLLKQSRQFNMRITDYFYNHLLGLPKPFFDTRKIGDLVARLNDTSRIQRVISQLAGNVIIDLLIFLVSAGFIFNYSWMVGLLCLAAMPFFYVLIYFNNKNIVNGQRAIMNSYAQVESNYISTLQGIEPIKNYNRQHEYSNRNKIIYLNFQDKIFGLGKFQIKFSIIVNVFGIILLNTILFLVSYEVIKGQLKTGQLIALLSICGSLLSSVASLALITIPINEAKIVFDRMFEFTSLTPEGIKTASRLESFDHLQVQQLGFRFPGRSEILKEVSFQVNKGEIIAIMGENGSGKTTLTQILLKNYTTDTGAVYINREICLNDISFQEWRNMVSIVPQQIHIFNGTVIENIAFDDVKTSPSKVMQFIREFGLAPFINSLPQSYQTLVGEEGINLSGGQKQMIALARALYHKPKLLILDEATASMDRASELFVLQLLSNLKKNLAIIFITHKINILKSFCDRIYILEKGTISNSGNHEQLLQTTNLYSAYWNDLVLP